MIQERKLGGLSMEEALRLKTTTMGKENSCSSNTSGSSSSVLTDHDDGIANYTCHHGGPPSPTVFARPDSQLLNSSPTTTGTSSSLLKKSGNSCRRSVKKRVVSMPIADVEGAKGGSGDCTPPADAWTWRKYGQKPIKGSPYPRGYYRCSSSKGCPARKQVERSRLDPTMLVVTYASEHNHPFPIPRSHSHQNRASHSHGNSRRPAAVSVSEATMEEEKEEVPPAPSASITNTGSSSPEENAFSDLGDASSFMPMASEFSWFSGLVETPLPTTETLLDYNVGMMLPGTCGEIGEDLFTCQGGEDDALFAGLGELPECSVVFRRQIPDAHGKPDESRRCSLTAMSMR